MPSHILPGMTSPPPDSAAPPERSADQRRDALARANRVRHERAQLKTALRRGEDLIAALLREPPECLASARVSEVLRALPGYGPAKVTRLLDACQVNPRKTLGGLSLRQREALTKALAR